jgi:hypothetical protein
VAVSLIDQVNALFADAATWDRSRTLWHEFRVAFTASQEPSGAAGRWFVTPHAVDAYRERTGRRRMSYETALGEIVSDSERAHQVKTLRSGAQLWRGPKPRRLRYIVMDDSPGLPVLVTVLGAFDR